VDLTLFALGDSELAAGNSSVKDEKRAIECSLPKA
jgi:hypothetical protein